MALAVWFVITAVGTVSVGLPFLAVIDRKRN